MTYIQKLRNILKITQKLKKKTNNGDWKMFTAYPYPKIVKYNY